MPSFTGRFARWLLVAMLIAGCDDESDSPQGGGGGGNAPPEPLPALTRAPLTTEETLLPSHAREPEEISNPRLYENIVQLLADGYGAYTTADGEPVVPLTLDDSAPPAAGPNAKMLTRFVHLADIQLADDESPARVVNVDSAGISGAFRPQEGHECKILNAAVRTINKLHEQAAVGFVLLGGDNVDNAQGNELSWVLSILSGSSSVDCDSGIDDDPVPGGSNDPKDPFVAEGLAMPSYWVNGNHDILNQGNFPAVAQEDEYLAAYAATGTRNWSMPGGPVFLGDIEPDERRKPLSPSELLAQVSADGDGHGISSDIVGGGRAMYFFDLEGAPLRIIVLDTAAPTGSAEGLLHQSEIDDFLVPAIESAAADDRLVIVTSHHISGKLTDGGEFGGVAQDDAVTTEAFREVLGSYPNVVMHLAGHTHNHQVGIVPAGAETTAYWEMESSALADFPNQMRVIEIWDLDNGFISVRATSLDYQTENDPIAEEGRSLGFLDFTSGWAKDGRGAAEDRNVELYFPKP